MGVPGTSSSLRLSCAATPAHCLGGDLIICDVLLWLWVTACRIPLLLGPWFGKEGDGLSLTHHLPHAMRRMTFSHVIFMTTLCWRDYHPHFMEEKTEVPRGEGTCPASPS